MTALVVRADANSLPLADSSVDLIVTSPPYFALRSYTDGGKHYAGQIGDEATPQEFLESLWAVTRECLRVLKPEGSLWVNLGDKYAGNSGGPQGSTGARATRTQAATYGTRRPVLTAAPPAKSLIGIPWRYALGCIDQLGLILRAEVIWSKPNGLPESVTDRVRRSHEQWFHFVQQPRYFSAVDEIREPHAPASLARYQSGFGQTKASAVLDKRYEAESLSANPLGKLPGSVWEIATSPLTVPAHLGVDHFAAFPPEWPKRIVQGWSPAGVCVECRQGRRPLRDSEKVTSRPGHSVYDQRMPGRHASGNQGREGRAGDYVVTIAGYACGCLEPTAPTRPAVVLDCFGGTGTTALVASALGRVGISTDLSADYCRLARWRTTDRGERARVLGVPKPPAEVVGQADLFGEDVA